MNKQDKFLRILCLCAMLTAVSVVIGILCKNFLTWNVYIRFTFENMPIIFIGYLFGPVWGTLCGLAADAVSCLCSSNPSWNPVISIGAGTVGFLSGLIPLFLKKRPPLFRLIVAAAFAHLVGQVCVKSVGKILFFGMPPVFTLVGLGFSAVICPLEIVFIRILLKNESIHSQLKGLTHFDDV